MNKFVQAIAGSAEGIKLKRAQDVATSAKLAQEGLINDLKQTVNVLEANLTKLLDIGPDSADSLRPVDRNFDAASWVAEVQALKLDLKRANEKVEIAIVTYNEWFTDVPAAKAGA